MTLLNTEFYNAEMKPLMAEWAFLWLQKQHLFGIDREEALRYMHEGAVPRGELTSKVELLDTAIMKTRISVGDIPPKPALVSTKAAGAGHHTMAGLEKAAFRRTAKAISVATAAPVANRPLLRLQLQRLEETMAFADLQRKLVH